MLGSMFWYRHDPCPAFNHAQASCLYQNILPSIPLADDTLKTYAHRRSADS
jgi:hypothetical protein